MPKSIRPIPSREDYYEGLATEWARKWVKRRAIETLEAPEIGTSIQLRDMPGEWLFPLALDELVALAKSAAGPEFASETEMCRVGRVVCMNQPEAALFLVWLHRKLNSKNKTHLKRAPRKLSDSGIADLLDLLFEESAESGKPVMVKQAVLEIEGIYGPREGGWTNIVNEALRQIRRNTVKRRP